MIALVFIGGLLIVSVSTGIPESFWKVQSKNNRRQGIIQTPESAEKEPFIQQVEQQNLSPQITTDGGVNSEFNADKGATEINISSEPPIIPGSELLLHVIDQQTGSPISDVTFVISIEYDPPFDGKNFSYTVFAAGASPYRIPITVPGSPSRAIITATKGGFVVSPALAIESGFYHERINPFRDGGVSEFLLKHTFTMNPVDR